MSPLARLPLLLALLCAGPALAQDATWVLGRWELVYDPEGRPADALEFLPDGDAVNVWPDGTRVPGIYVVTEQGVKAVFTLQGRDLITTFHADAAHSELRIVTSATGRESVYRKRAAP